MPTYDVVYAEGGYWQLRVEAESKQDAIYMVEDGAANLASAMEVGTGGIVSDGEQCDPVEWTVDEVDEDGNIVEEKV